jgi:hypothetical protein
MSPVTTIFELKPMRVRTIFICSGSVFCASSTMMKLSLRVRPRMNAMGCDLDDASLEELVDLLHVDHFIRASYSGRRYGSTFLLECAWQESEFLAGFDRGRVSRMRLTRFVEER